VKQSIFRIPFHHNTPVIFNHLSLESYIKSKILLTVKEIKEELSPSPDPIKIKADPEEPMTVESSEPQDLTVSCTSTNQKSLLPPTKYISISVQQCQTGAAGRPGDPIEKPKIAGRKRSTKSSDSDECGYKRSRPDEREASISMYVEQASSGGLEDVQKHADSLQQEIHGLSALARTKELEWNDVIRMKKVKEEMYLRLIRRKQVRRLLYY